MWTLRPSYAEAVCRSSQQQPVASCYLDSRCRLSVSVLRIHGFTVDFVRHMYVKIDLCACCAYMGVQAYSSLLGVLTFTFTWFSVAQSSIDVTLLSAWAVYAYRDVWPLLTYHLKPLDAAEGPILWTKISILTLAAIVIPLIRPRHYVPYNPAVCNVTHISSTLIDHYNRNLRRNPIQSRQPAYSPARSSLTWTLLCWQPLAQYILVWISSHLFQIPTI